MNILPKQPFPSIGNILEAIGKIGKFVWDIITGKDKKQDEIAKQKSLNPEKSEANEIAEMNKLLSEYRQNIIVAGSDMEREMIAECSMQMQEIMDVFDKFNENFKLTRSESIRRRFRRLNDELKGTFADYIGKRISLDDSECVKTLKLPAGDLKSQRLQELKQNVFIEATNAMIDKIKNTVDDFSETVEEYFMNNLDRAESSIEEKTSAFDKLSKTANGDTDAIESVLLKAHYVIAMCDYADGL